MLREAHVVASASWTHARERMQLGAPGAKATKPDPALLLEEMLPEVPCRDYRALLAGVNHIERLLSFGKCVIDSAREFAELPVEHIVDEPG